MTEKDKKYDRQLRLWGDHGQRALESARICLINVTSTGTEILKNLILPGIGSFVIVDGSRITGEDAGSNFFLDADFIGESKSKVATQMLLELNPDVKGEYVEDDANKLLETNPHFFTGFTVVVACNLEEESLKKLASLLWDANIPLLTCLTYGFIGYLRLVVQEHCIVESHPDNSHEDLRLDNPIPEFADYADSINLDALDKKDHSHTPYLIILYKYLKLWREQHGGAMPSSWKEKKEFKANVLDGIRKNEHGSPEDEENFDEAARQVNSALVSSCVPPEVEEILGDPKCVEVAEDSSNFWMLANGLRQFVENDEHKLLPLRGSLPDMFSDSERYVKLQNIYQEKAKRDMEAVVGYVSQICTSLGCGNGRLAERDVKRFCRNAHFLRLVRTRSLEDEYKCPSKTVIHHLTSDDNSDAVWYVMLRIVEQFRTLNGCYPGLQSEDVESDTSKLKNSLRELLRTWGVPGATEAISEDYVQEICRCGASDIHSVASYMGGVASQEVIKLITAQYVPVSNAYIYNGIKSTSMTLEV